MGVKGLSFDHGCSYYTLIYNTGRHYYVNWIVSFAGLKSTRGNDNNDKLTALQQQAIKLAVFLYVFSK